jgi:hypothetical protein
MSTVSNNTSMNAIDATGTVSIPVQRGRKYLAVQAASAPITVTISGGKSFVIAAGSWWGPQPAPTNDIVFSGGDGTIITG